MSAISQHDIRIQLNSIAFPVSTNDRLGVRPSQSLAPYRRSVMLADSCAILCATLIGYFAKFGLPTSASFPESQILTPFVMLLWILALTARGAYNYRIIGVGTEEFKRLVSATVLLFALITGLSFLLKYETSRAFVFLSLPVGLALLIAERWTLRRFLYRQRAVGKALTRTIALGSSIHTEKLTKLLHKDAYAGYQVVAEIEPPDSTSEHTSEWLAHVIFTLESTQAQAIAVTSGTHLNGDVLRQLSWAIEGRGIDLLVTPSLIDIAGPRTTIRAAAGLPLIHLEESAFSTTQRVAKRVIDIIGAIIGLVLLSPLLAIIALTIKVTSPGPILFTQRRIGRNGEPFLILKFRTMRPGADHERESLRKLTGHESASFKMVNDPRITNFGAFLRRWSLDELPQLLNVLTNDMSLVGPRPHPIDDVVRYNEHDFRRLLVKPGITGLWQVAGRSSLEWSEAVRLDLLYVDHWSVIGDLVLIARTPRVVVGGQGAL